MRWLIFMIKNKFIWNSRVVKCVKTSMNENVILKRFFHFCVFVVIWFHVEKIYICSHEPQRQKERDALFCDRHHAPLMMRWDPFCNLRSLRNVWPGQHRRLSDTHEAFNYTRQDVRSERTHPFLYSLTSRVLNRPAKNNLPSLELEPFHQSDIMGSGPNSRATRFLLLTCFLRNGHHRGLWIWQTWYDHVWGFCLRAGGAAVTLAGVSRFGCVTWPPANISAWWTIKDSCWWTKRKQMSSPRPSASAPQKWDKAPNAERFFCWHHQCYPWFSVTRLQEKLDFGLRKEVDGMGVPDIKYGDSVCYIQHVDSALWLTYQSVDAKCARMGGVQRKVWIWHQLITSNYSLNPSWMFKNVK